jgi:ribose-phosphate pyrophosphokinase
MMVVLPMPGNEAFATRVAAALRADVAQTEFRRFPDGETYVRLHGNFDKAHVAVVCTLADPDPQLARLLFAAGAARDLGASRVTLVAPYLAYMRQDKAFQLGEAVSSRYFATIISSAFDALVTVDPHLHRYKTLSEIYKIPTRALHAAPLLGDWISRNIHRPLVIGPDEEAEQWVSAIAQRCAAPFAVLKKTRAGDREVHIQLPDLAAWRGHTPVLIDDIVSSGRTLAETARLLTEASFAKPCCLVVHAIFAEDALARITPFVANVLSTDAVPHSSNGIGLAELVAEGVAGL